MQSEKHPAEVHRRIDTWLAGALTELHADSTDEQLGEYIDALLAVQLGGAQSGVQPQSFLLDCDGGGGLGKADDDMREASLARNRGLRRVASKT